MRQVATMTQIHREDGVARLTPRKIHGFIRLCTTVRLDVGMVGPEELLGAIDCQLLYLVGILLPAIVTPAWVTLAIFISKDTPKRLQYITRDIILARDELQTFALALLLMGDEGSNSCFVHG